MISAMITIRDCVADWLWSWLRSQSSLSHPSR